MALHRAVALAEVEGADAALALADGLSGFDLDGYHLFHAIRADLLRRMGRTPDARAAYERALALTNQDTQRRFLERRLVELT